MKFLADENFPPTLISYLQKKRHDVKRIQRSASGISDMNVRERAVKENRIIFTFDKGFLKTREKVELINTMVFDFPNLTPEEILPFMDSAIEEINKLKRKKKPFSAVYSNKGLQLYDPTSYG